MRQLMVKSRHKILMPTLVLHLTKTKLNPVGQYRSSFGRNLHERTDEPVFTISDAVDQLKTNDPTRTDVEKAMDDFFVTHLPKEVIEAAGDVENNELDEDAIRRQKKADVPYKRNRSQAQLSNAPQGSNTKESVNGGNSRVKRQKSDLTLAFMDSSPQVAKLAQRSEMGQKIDKMRKVAKSKHRGSALGPMSQFQGPIPVKEGHIPRPRATMSPDAFKRKYSKDLTKDVAMMARINSIQRNSVSKYKP